MTARTALVIGAGISGLTAAIALHRAGVDVEVVEITADHSPVGAGIVMGANAVAALQYLGVDVVSAGAPVPSMNVRTASGRLLQSAPVADLGPAVALARSTLHRELAAALPAGVRVRFADSVARLAVVAGGVDVVLASGQSRRVDLLVAADGLRSPTRGLAGLDVPLRYSGYTCWRVLVDDPGVGEVVEYWGRGERVGLVPVDGHRVYAYLVRNAAPGDPGPRSAAALRESFRGYPDVVDAVLAGAGDRDLLHHDLNELSATVWGRGPVWLTGDAAHAMLPNLGQGAAMGIEDAVALGAAVRETGPAAGLRLLVRVRRDRVERIRRDSRAFGRVGQWDSPVACAVRDAAYAGLPAAVGRWQSRSVVQPGLDLVAAARTGTVGR